MEFLNDALIKKLRFIKKGKVTTLVDEEDVIYGALELKSVNRNCVSWTYQYIIIVGVHTYDLIEISKPFSFATTSIRVMKGQKCLFDSVWNFDPWTYLIYPIRGNFKFHTQSETFLNELNIDRLVKFSLTLRFIESPQPQAKFYSWMDSHNNLVLKIIPVIDNNYLLPDKVETTLDLTRQDNIAFILFVIKLYYIPKKEVFYFILLLMGVSFLFLLLLFLIL